MAAYEIPGIGMVDLGDIDFAAFGSPDYGAATANAYDIPSIGQIDLGNFDPSTLGGLGYGGGYAAGPATSAAPTGRTLTDYLNTLDDLQRGRYDKPVADMNATELAELSGISGLQFVTNIGRGASTKANRSGFVPLVEDAEYRIVNERGENKTAFSGIGQEGLIGVYNTAQNLSAEGGKKADWYVEAKDPSTGRWVKVADDDPPSDIAGDILKGIAWGGVGVLTGGLAGLAAGVGAVALGIDDEIMKYGLPIVLSLTPLGPVAGAALGSAIGTAYNGGNIEEILMAAGISAATAGVLKVSGLGDKIGGLISEIPGANEVINSISQAAQDIGAKVAGDAIAKGATEAAAKSAAQKAIDEIVVNGFNSVVNAAASGAVGGIGGAAADFLADAVSNTLSEATTKYGVEQQFDQQFGTGTPATGEPPITVTAKINAAVQKMVTAGISSASSSLFPDLTAEELAKVQELYDQQKPPGTVVTGAPGTDAAVGGIGGVGGDIVVKAPPKTQQEDAGAGVGSGLTDIVVNAPKTPVDERPGGDATAGAAAGAATDATKPTPKDDGKGIGVKDWIRLGLLSASAIGGGAGGGGSGTPVDNTPLTYTPITRKPTIAAGVGQAPFDVFTYGQGVPGAQQSEFLFFEPFSWKQPAGAAPINVSTGRPQAQLDAEAAAAAAAQKAAYDANAAKFNTYQDNLAAQVAAGTITPEKATADATAYAGTLGLTLAPVTTPAASPGGMKDGGEVDDEMVRHLMEYKRGGGHRGPGPVKGVGSGQEDLIPAWLSDGEYVWSAQDVADLGDGSTDEGVRRLDRMRQMVRRRAGRKDVKKIAKPQQGIDTMLKAVGGVA